MSSDPFSFSVSTDAPLDMRASAAKATPARTPMLFSGVGGQSWGYGQPYGDMLGAGRLGGLLPGAKFDYNREAGNIWSNSVFAICLGWASDNFPNAKIQVTRTVNGKDQSIPDHPLVKLFRRPNLGYSSRALWSAVLLSLKIDGNAYLMKARNMGGYGQTDALWWVPHWQMFPQWPTGPTTTYIDHYKYVVDGRVYQLDPKNVVHIKDGLDPINTRLGLGRVKAQLRNIVGTNEADGYTASLLRNMGIPAVMFSPKGDFPIDDPQAKEIYRRWKMETGGENRGSPWVNSLAVTAEKLGLSPQELALDTIMDRPVANICASFRVSPMVVGLPDTQRTYSNYGEARKAAWEDCLIPTQDMIAEEGLQTQLLRDFGDPETETVSWDRSKVPALQEGDDLRANRAVQLFTNMLGYRDECRDVLGMPPVDEGEEVWYADVMGGPVDPNDPNADPNDPNADPNADPNDEGDDDPNDPNDDGEGGDDGEAIKAMRMARSSGKSAKRLGGASGASGRHGRFEEGKHPRDHGQFASKPGDGKTKSGHVRDPDRPGRALVEVAPHKLDPAWQKDTGFHVGKDGTGAAKPGAYAAAKRNIEAGKTHTPIVALDKAGAASFTDGRHHFAAARDAGHASVTVSVPVGQAKQFKRDYGPDSSTPKGKIAKAEHVVADDAEKHILKGIGGKHTALKDGKYYPADVVVTRNGGKKDFVEVKAKVDGNKNTYTMHHDAILRKAELHASTPGSQFHTVVVDLRHKTGNGTHSGHELYYKRGVASEAGSAYAFSKMHKVKNHAELNRLVKMKDHELPEAARGSQPKVTADLKQKAASAHASRLGKDQRLKARKKAERTASA